MKQLENAQVTFPPYECFFKETFLKPGVKAEVVSITGFMTLMAMLISLSLIFLFCKVKIKIVHASLGEKIR